MGENSLFKGSTLPVIHRGLSIGKVVPIARLLFPYLISQKLRLKNVGTQVPCAAPAAIESFGVSVDDIKNRMGNGYIHIQEVLDGKRIDGWAASHIEFGISKAITRAQQNSYP